jgi:hypothetical protein
MTTATLIPLWTDEPGSAFAEPVRPAVDDLYVEPEPYTPPSWGNDATFREMCDGTVLTTYVYNATGDLIDAWTVEI